MSAQPLSSEQIAHLLEPYLGNASAPFSLSSQLTVYLDLILKWNARVNLTAIREPEEIVRRHFGESLFAGIHLNEDPGASQGVPCDSLLDLGSGAGFPGIPIQLLSPGLPVTLAESRGRKAAFLREAVRMLGLRTEVWGDRAEAMPPDSRFHTVALRAVDDMGSAVAGAARRASHRILVLGTRNAAPALPASFRLLDPIPLPNSRDGVLLIAERAEG